MGASHMRVGVDARAALSSKRRGEGKALLRLYQEISRVRPEWEIIFYGYPGGVPTGIANVREHVFDAPGFRFNTWENFALPIHAHLDRIDVLHCAGSSAPRFIAGKSIVLTVHDVIPLVCNDGWTSRQVEQFERQIRYGLTAAKMVIAVSESTKMDIIRLFDTPADKIRVVYWGCDITERSHDPQELKSTDRLEKLGIPQRYVMAFGGGAPRKNAERVISAFGKVTDDIDEINLILVGAGAPDVRERYQSIARQAGIEKNVFVLGFVDDDDLATLYENALCLVYPSLYEGFGLPVLEAMAKNIPVVASNRSSIPEVTGNTAILTDPENEDMLADAIIHLLTDESLRNKLSALGYERAGRFSWRQTAEDTIAILEGSANT